MSKSLERVRAALIAAGIDPQIRETELARTAADAASAIGCEIDQIVKSIIFLGESSGKAMLFLTAGGNRVDVDKASEHAREQLGKAAAGLIRAQTGFAIGGVAPIGHLTPIQTFIDPRLNDFDVVWAAAGTPHHVFPMSPVQLVELTGGTICGFT